MTEFIKQLRVAIPNTKVVDITVLSHVDDTITWQRTMPGTHSAPMKGIPASSLALMRA